MFCAPIRRYLAALAVLLCLLFAPRTSRAEPGDELTVYVLTFGPGDHAFFKFGHDAIWIHNEAAPKGNPLKRDAVYNWGTFAFGDPALIPKFVRGKFMYWLSKQPIGLTVRLYQSENRTVEAQELNLTAAQKKALFDALEENAKDENKYYKYDYYRDNCATRVRDAIDKVIGGKLKEASQNPASMTWRHHTLRLTQDDAILSMALTVVMSNVIDRPLNQWEEMFLPAYVQEGLRRVKVPGPDGTEIPLVKTEEVQVVVGRDTLRFPVKSTRGPVHSERPSWLLWNLLAGILLGGGVFVAARSSDKSLPARIGLGALLFLEGFLSILGVLFVFVWIATDHEVGWHNENILQLVPWGVALMGFCFGVARRKPKAVRRARLLAQAAVVASLFGLVWKVLPWMRQDNYWIIALAAPMWIGSFLGLRHMEKGLGSHDESKSEPQKKARPAKTPEPKKSPEEESPEPEKA